MANKQTYFLNLVLHLIQVPITPVEQWFSSILYTGVIGL